MTDLYYSDLIHKSESDNDSSDNESFLTQSLNSSHFDDYDSSDTIQSLTMGLDFNDNVVDDDYETPFKEKEEVEVEEEPKFESITKDTIKSFENLSLKNNSSTNEIVKNIPISNLNSLM